LRLPGFRLKPTLGQTGTDIRYLVHTANGVIFITDRGITLSAQLQTLPAFELLGSNLSTEWQPQSSTGETFSYFIGRDPSKWIRDVPQYARLLRSGVYPGIDLVLYSNGNQLEYDFLLAPHAEPAAIRLKLKGSPKVSIGQDGALIVTGP
jgi:hypothetical protein